MHAQADAGQLLQLQQWTANTATHTHIVLASVQLQDAKTPFPMRSDVPAQ
jgi:hypothetical protein